MQMLECIVNQDILLDYNTDDLRNTAEFIQRQAIAVKTTKLTEHVEKECRVFVEEVLLPYIQKSLLKPRFRGDHLFALKHGLKCLSTLLIHMSKQQQNELCKKVDELLKTVFRIGGN